MRSSITLLISGLACALATDTYSNSGIAGIHTGGEASSAPVTVVIGSDSYTQDGATGNPILITSTGTSSGMTTTTASLDSSEFTASTSPSDGLGARVTQAPILGAGIAGLAFLAL